MEICQKIAQEYYFFLVVFGVSKLDYLLNVQGNMFAWSIHHMSSKSHAIEMEFSEMKSRITACSFIYHGSNNQRILQNYVSTSRITELQLHIEKWKIQTAQDLNSGILFIIAFRFYPQVVILYWQLIKHNSSEQEIWSDFDFSSSAC